MIRRTADQVRVELEVLGCQAGSEEAFDRLVRRWQRPLWRHALRMTGRADAAWEVTQEAWLGIVRGIRGLRVPARFRAWAYRIVTNRAAAWVARRGRIRDREQALEDEPRARERVGGARRLGRLARAVRTRGRARAPRPGQGRGPHPREPGPPRTAAGRDAGRPRRRGRALVGRAPEAGGRIYPSPTLLERLVAAGTPFTTASDAHRPEEIGAGFGRHRAELDDRDVRELATFRRRRRASRPR